MQTTTILGLAAAAATGIATSAFAGDPPSFNLNDIGGGTADFVFSYDSLIDGPIDEVDVVVTFNNQGDLTWAGDLVMGIITPDGYQVEWGGYDLVFGWPNNAGDFPADWDSDVSGDYTATIDLETCCGGLEGSGDWYIYVMNGYSYSTGAEWADGTMTPSGCADCPDFDCNENGIEDAEDISNGTSQDCDLNTVPDECDPDCDNDGTPNACDKDECPGIEFDHTGAGGTFMEIPFTHSGPLNEMGVELTFTNAGDATWASDILIAIHAADGSVGWEVGGYDLTFGYTQLGGFPEDWAVETSGDYSYTFDFTGLGVEGSGDMILAIANGYSASIDGTNWNGLIALDLCTDCIVDCNENGVADEEDISSGTSEDCNTNGKPDECDIADGAGDANNDGIPDTCQLECGDVLEWQHTGPGTTNGGVPTSFTVEFDGAVSAIRVSASYVNDSADETWAGDVLIGITDPSGNSVEFGAYDDTLGYTSIGDFSAAWDVADTGDYPEETFDASAGGLSGNGTWTIQVHNGWMASAGASWDLDVTLCGVGDGGGGGCNDSPDLNNDGCVNGADVGLILSVWLSTDAPYGDVNCDGIVNGADFGLVLSGWGCDP